MRGITVKVTRKVLDGFKRGAREAFPREKYCYLLGHEYGDVVQISELYYPEDADKHSTETQVNVRPIWLVEAEEHAKDIGLSVVGDLHSHPYLHEECSAGTPGRHQSEADLDYAPRWQKIAGICRVTESQTGKLRASIRFWPPIIPVTMEVL